MQTFRNDWLQRDSNPQPLVRKRTLNHLVKLEFPSEWKKANVVSVHKKSDMQSLKHYRPISLLPIFGKILERIIYNNIFEYLTTNKLISDNQVGFKPSDSCVNQLLSITHDTYHSLDSDLEVRGVFLDISKRFWKSMAWRPDTQIKPIWNFGKSSLFNNFFSKKSWAKSCS